MRYLRPAGVPGAHSHCQRGGQVGAGDMTVMKISLSCSDAWAAPRDGLTSVVPPDWGSAAWKNTRGQVLVGHVSRGAGKWQHTGVREARKRSVGCQVPGKYIALQLLHLKNILNTLKCTYCTCPRATIKMKGHVAGVKVKTLIMWVLPSDDF